MKVLYVVNSLTRECLAGPGDACHHTFMQNAFRRLGCQIRQYPEPSDAEHGRDSHRLSRFGYHVMQSLLPRRVSSNLRAAYSLWHDERSRRDLHKVIAQYKPAIVFEKYSSFQTGCANAARAHGVPYVVQFHAPAEESPHYHASRTNAALLRSRMAAAGAAATTVVAVSRYLQKYLTALGIPRSKILVLANGVDLDLVANAGSGESMRQKLGIPTDAFVAGFVGTMRPWQGCGLLPEVFAMVKAGVRNAVFLLVGPFADDRQRGQFEGQLQRRGLRGDFVLPGSVPAGEVPNYVRAMDVCVMADSTDYCSPMKLFEYGACARAVVMPRRSSIQEVIRDGDNGLLFNPSSPREMAEKIIYLAKRPQLGASLGARLQQTVRSKHTYVSNVKTILEHVRSCRGYGCKCVARAARGRHTSVF